MKKQITTSIVLAALAVAVAGGRAGSGRAAPAAALAPQAPPAKPVNMDDMRHHIYVMEGALARAVDYGAKQLNREILAVMPGVFMLEGEARARGVHLDGYGVFFDVRVPMMRQSMVWSLRMMMDQDDAANQATINDLRKSHAGRHRSRRRARRSRRRSASSNARHAGVAAAQLSRSRPAW